MIMRRYLDISEVDTNDFKVRQHKPLLSVVLGAYLLAFVIIIGTASISNEIGGMPVFTIVTLVMLGFSAWVTYFNTQRSRDLVTATEFQNALFSSIAHLHSSFIVIVRNTGGIMYYSSNYPAMFSGTRRRGLTTIDAIFETDGISAEDAARIRSALADGKPEQLICEVKDVDGNSQPIRLTIQPIPRPSGFFVISGSPLRRRVSDNAPSQGRDGRGGESGFFRDGLNAVPIGSCLFDKDGDPSYIHPDIELWLGYQRYEIQRQHLTLDALISDETPGDLKSTFLTDKLFDGHVYFAHKSGRSLRATVTKRAVVDEKADFNGTILIVQPFDQSFAHLSSFSASTGGAYAGTPPNQESIDDASTTGLSRVMQEAPIGIVVIDKDGNIIQNNRFFNQMVESVTANPRNLMRLIKNDFHDDLKRRIQSCMTQGFSEDEPLSVEIATSDHMAASIYVTCHNQAEGHVAAYLIETTEQKSLEMKYAHSQKMQAVGQLAGGIAHDFNNLLTAMIGFCDLLLMRHPAGDQSFADIMQIKQNANRAANLVRQLLAFSRRQTLQPTLLDITDVLAELSNLIRRLIGENIELNMVHGRDLGMIKVDQGQLEQVIINLAVNARDAMADGGELTIRSANIVVNNQHPLDAALISPGDDDPVAAGDYVMVEVIDNGCGIARENVSKIFEPFFSTKEVGSGTGLGLATVYGIIKQTGGYILVDSKENEGTRFVLLFTLHQPSESQQKEATQIQGEPPASKDLTGRGTILLVEDETPVRSFSARALRNKGYTVIEADCAEAALELMETQGSEIEVIISDVIMPGMDGPSMVQQIWESRPDIKVIFISGYAEDALVKMENSTRPYDFLPKPFTLKQLAQKVKEVVSK